MVFAGEADFSGVGEDFLQVEDLRLGRVEPVVLEDGRLAVGLGGDEFAAGEAGGVGEALLVLLLFEGGPFFSSEVVNVAFGFHPCLSGFDGGLAFPTGGSRWRGVRRSCVRTPAVR